MLDYNHTDHELLIRATRVRRVQLKQHVQRVTLGAQETFWLIQLAIEELKSPAGPDESGVSLFKTPGRKVLISKGCYNINTNLDKLKITPGLSICLFSGANVEVWAAQQQHLECIQDPTDMNMYRVAHTTTINNVDVPCYKCLRGSNSLEAFHRFLPNMIPATQL